MFKDIGVEYELLGGIVYLGDSETGLRGHYIYIGIKDGIYYLANDSNI
jgi:hypothetical protein